MKMQKSARVRGFIRATADQSHPLQTRLSIIITDFEPNGNKQGIPLSEADNILATALHTPLKINFDGLDHYGHKGAIPIGPITNVYFAEDNGRQVIAGDAVVWNDLYEDISDHLKKAFAEGLGTSWEIYFKESERDDNDIEWLNGCVFAGTCVVSVPAYGPSRTRVLAVAESLEKHADQINERLSMANVANDVVDTSVDTSTQESTGDVPATSGATDDVQTVREDISAAMNLLAGIYEGFYGMLDETYQIEQNLATTDMESVAEQFTKLVASIQKNFTALKEKASTAEQALSELHSQREAELLTAKAQERKELLAEAGMTVSEERLPFYRDLDDDTFNALLTDMRTVNRASAEQNVLIPDPVESTSTISTADLAKAIIAKKRG